jgi:NAD(P)-dependent dehydrogenase (short-subunit alcohol dehydrogenase family)
MAGTALVTGSARGIGRARAFVVAKNVDIALVDLLDSEMTATVRDLKALGGFFRRLRLTGHQPLLAALSRKIALKRHSEIRVCDRYLRWL